MLFLAEMPAVIAPQNDDRVVTVPALIERVEQHPEVDGAAPYIEEGVWLQGSESSGAFIRGVNENWIFLYNYFEVGDGSGYRAEGGSFDALLPAGLHHFVPTLPGGIRQGLGVCLEQSREGGHVVGVVRHGQGIGRCLLLTALKDMTAQGYAYAVIGWVGPEAFFAKTANALPIPDSSPGLYRNMLPDTDNAHPSD